MSVVNPQRDSRRGNAWRLLGVVLTVGGSLLLVTGVGGIMVRALSGDPERMFGAFDFFWMPFVGAFALAVGIMAWVAGNLLRGSARFAQGASGTLPMAAPTSGAAVPGWSCPKCGNQNQVGDAVCSVCGTDRP
ncbi:MAG: zinc finger Ran-binding domain-containing protein [Actinomycetota bacterium]